MSQVMSKLKPNDSIRLSRIVIASSAAAIGYWAYLVFGKSREKKQSRHATRIVYSTSNTMSKNKKPRPNLNQTLMQLKVILRSIVTYREVFLAAGMSVGLLFRTMLDLYQISNGTLIEKAIITGSSQDLLESLASFSVYMPLLAFVNNFIKYNGDNLALNLRNKLSKKLYAKYMTDLTFYKLSQQQQNGNSEIELKNVDQLLTSDVDKFCISIVQLYNNLTKPLLDIIILVKRLSSTYTGIQTPAIMMLYLAFAGGILTQARKSLSTHIINETQCEGQLRYIHSRLIQNSEEISFYRGNKRELLNLEDALGDLNEAIRNLILFKFKIGFLDNVVGRYISTIVGYLALAMPFFSQMYQTESNETKMGYYYVAGRMMVKLAESIQRVIIASNDMSKLSAYTLRVQTLLDSVDKTASESKVMLQKDFNESEEDEDLESYDHKDLLVNGNRKDSNSFVAISDSKSPTICLKNATISTPNGDILIRNMTLTIKQHQNVLISGPNGSGKSSVFRVLAGLWQLERGQVIRPPAEQLFYICQKPYMTLGTFRDQIIYPDTYSDFKNLKQDSDESLIAILKIVSLDYLLEREPNFFDSIQDWQEVLSGGEKQRIALARLIYHKPQFAILDECTSAVSIDVEQNIYEYFTSVLNITLLSVTHRVKQLYRFHQFILKLDRDGSYQFKRLDIQDIE